MLLVNGLSVLIHLVHNLIPWTPGFAQACICGLFQPRHPLDSTSQVLTIRKDGCTQHNTQLSSCILLLFQVNFEIRKGTAMSKIVVFLEIFSFPGHY